MTTRKRKSGGARAVEAKHAKRAAARARAEAGQKPTGYDGARVEGNRPVDVLDEAINHLREAMRQAADDAGMPPEQKREQINRIAANLGKLAEPKKIIEELGAELREAHEVIQGLRRAAQEPSRDTEGTPPTSEH